MKGAWRDEMLYPGGKRVLLGEGKNLVVNGGHIVVASCMKQDPTYGGFLYWALGDGNTSNTAVWDAAVLAGTQAPARTNAALLREVYRKAVGAGDISFVDGTGAPSGSPTNRLQVVTTFLEAEPSGSVNVSLREWGLFGATATGTAGSGLLINTKQHVTYTKTPIARLVRTLIMTF